MRVCHISDTHGTFPKLEGRFDLVIHSGDFFPNSYAIVGGNKVQEMEYQKIWLTEKISKIKNMLNGSPLLFILGNHDFLSPDLMEEQLQKSGIVAFNLTNKCITFNQINFYGFPYIPYINGGWNYELRLPEMQIEADKMVNYINSHYVEVLVCHSAISNCLDLSYSNENFGSTVITTALDYKIDKDMLPQFYLHGHIHEAAGVTIRNNMLISNAATTQQILEI